VVTIDGTRVEAAVTRIDPEGKVTTAGGETFGLQQLRTIGTGAADAAKQSEASTAYPLGMGELVAGKVTIDDGIVNVHVLDNRRWSLPLETVRAIRFADVDDARTADLQPFEEARRSGALTSDRAYAWGDGKLTPVRCIVRSLDDRELTVEYRDETRTIPRERLAGLVLAAAAEAPDRGGHAGAGLVDGSTVWGEVRGLADGRLQLEAFPGTTLDIPWSAVRVLNIRSENVAYLSDLEPVQVEQKAIVTYPWTYRRDRNVLNKPLRLAGETYSRGLGVHAHNRLVFELDGNYQAFAATVGIDDDAGPEGDCVFVVSVDGDERLATRVTAKASPETVRVELNDAGRLVLEVKPGENLDLGDVANWCEARLLKE
jgi:hypothetical protein